MSRSEWRDIVDVNIMLVMDMIAYIAIMMMWVVIVVLVIMMMVME